MTLRHWLSIAAAGLIVVGSVPAARSEDAGKITFGVLRAPAAEAVRGQAQDWLKSVGKTDEATQKSFEQIWKADRPVLYRLADTLSLGDPQAAKLLKEARDPSVPAPTEVPAVLKDDKQPAFFRANLTLAYAKALSSRRIYEETLDALRLVQPEQVVDPSAYLFHKAVAEHAMLQKTDAERSISRLLDDVPDAPDRYKLVATLMYLDMRNWKDKDLASIARKMDDIERRLDLARGGPVTQKKQREVIARLDELIKKLENQQKQQQQQAGGGGGGGGGQQPGCPSGGQSGSQPGNTNQPSSPQQDSVGGSNSGPGKVDEKKLREYAEVWGKLPEKERTRAMMELTRDMPPRYREVIETYFKKLASNQQP